MAVKIKICGIRDYEDALLSAEEGADAIGFIFCHKSPRFILPKEARKIIQKLPCFVNKVGVFVDEKQQVVREIADFVGLDTLQFHGNESAVYCRKFKNDFSVIKSFFPKKPGDLSLVTKFAVNGYLLDIPFEEKEARFSLKLLDEKVLKEASNTVKFFVLSGGLSSDNVAAVVRKFKPYAVDVARGVEKFPGKKDAGLIRKFIKAVRSADG